MRILLVTAPPWAHTGYGMQARSLVKRLKADGHEIAWLPMGSFGNGLLEHDDISFLPPSLTDDGGNETVVAHAQAWNADVVYSLYDAWKLKNYGGANFRWIAHAPVDGDPIGQLHVEALKKAWRVVGMSKHGQQRMIEAGFNASYIPLAFEADTFYQDAAAGRQFRQFIGVPGDAFVVGSVGLNYRYPGRKGFDKLIEAFMRFKEGKDAYLYLHTNPLANESLDLNKVCDFFGVRDEVIFARPYTYLLGYKDEAMRAVYNAMDCFILATQGEGFGVPIIEALACGVPVIATDCTSIPELVEDTTNGILVKPSDRYMNPGYYFNYLPSVDGMVEALEALYEKHELIANGASLGTMHAARFPNLRGICAMTAKPYAWDRVYQTYWRPFLADVEREIAHAQSVTVENPNQRSAAVLEFHEDYVRKIDGPLANVAKEYQLLSTFDHPNIIRPIGSGVTEFGRFYMDLPRYKRSLDQIDPSTLREEQKQRILAGVDAALNYLHKCGVAHRDVHPSNVLVTDDYSAVLIDFSWTDHCSGVCVDFRPWEVPERAVPTVQRGLDQRGYHTIVTHVRGISLAEAKATGLPGVPYQQVDGVGERDPSIRWEMMQPDVKGKRVLDVGCNLGYFAARALKEGAISALGVDHDEATVEAARRLHPGVEFRVGDLNNGGLPDGQFDVAFVLSVLQHLKHPEQVLARIRELAPVVYVEVPDGLLRLDGEVVGRSERNRDIVRLS